MRDRSAIGYRMRGNSGRRESRFQSCERCGIIGWSLERVDDPVTGAGEGLASFVRSTTWTSSGCGIVHIVSEFENSGLYLVASTTSFKVCPSGWTTCN